MVAHVLSRCVEAVGAERVVLLTSTNSTDDPLEAYVRRELDVPVFRGDLVDVVSRFQACLQAFPAEWFVRVSGDSPALDPALIGWMLERWSDELDLLTNVRRRTFPPGQSVEIVRSATFQCWQSDQLDADEQEHVTQHFYRNPGRFRIQNVTFDGEPPHRRMVVDTPDDLPVMESILASPPYLFAAGARLEPASA